MTVHFVSVIITIVFIFFFSCFCFCQALFPHLFMSFLCVFQNPLCAMISIWISSYVIHQRAHQLVNRTGWRNVCVCASASETERQREWKNNVVINQKLSNKSGLEKHVLTIVCCVAFSTLMIYSRFQISTAIAVNVFVIKVDTSLGSGLIRYHLGSEVSILFCHFHFLFVMQCHAWLRFKQLLTVCFWEKRRRNKHAHTHTVKLPTKNLKSRQCCKW